MSVTGMGRRAVLAGPVAAVLAAAMPALTRPAAAQDFGQVSAGVRRLYAALIGAMKAGKATPFAQRYGMLAQPVAQALDLPAILQTAVGPTWPSLTAAQQASLLTAFQRYSVATYADQFSSFGNEKLDVLPGLRPLGTGQVVLHTQIVSSSGETHVIDYVMKQAPDGWKAVDILLDGTISRVAVLRSDFRRLLARGGPEALVGFLQQKTSDLSGGAALP